LPAEFIANIDIQLQSAAEASAPPIHAANGNVIRCDGIARIQISVGGRAVITPALVTPDLHTELMVGWRELMAL